jgi:hypothetical protein
MASSRVSTLLVLALLAVTAVVFAQQRVPGSERVPGSAIVRVADSEYTIPIECNDASRPELGFSTEPARITKQRTGRTSGVRLTVRPWKETSYLIISLDRYVAWVPPQATSGGIFRMTLDMSPVSFLADGTQKLLTYDEWMAGNRPAGLEGVTFEANCRERDPNAPAVRKGD